MSNDIPLNMKYILAAIPMLISITAIFISVIALLNTRKHNRILMTPYINFYHQGPSLRSVNRDTELYISIKNTGLGPALISNVTIFSEVDGIICTHQSWHPVGELMKFGAPFLFFTDITNGVSLRSGEECKLLWVDMAKAHKYVSDKPPRQSVDDSSRIRTPKEADIFFQHIAQSMKQLLILITFKDSYGKEYKTYWSVDPMLCSYVDSHSKGQ